MTIQDKLATANFQLMKADIHIQTMTTEADQLRTRIATLEAENARLTAAHAMQDESLVVLPRHMVNSIEEQLKDYKAAASNLAKHLEAINNICERGDEFIPTEVGRAIRKHCEAANVMEAL